MPRLLHLVLLTILITSCSASKSEPEAAAPPKPTVDKAKFDALYRAGKQLTASTQVGITYLEFGKLLQSFATELSIVNDKVKLDEEKRLAGVYEEALAVYKDSYTLWREKIDFSDDIWKGQIIVSIEGSEQETEVSRIAKTYSIPSESHTLITGKKWTGIPGDSFQRVWVTGAAKLDTANKKLME